MHLKRHRSNEEPSQSRGERWRTSSEQGQGYRCNTGTRREGLGSILYLVLVSCKEDLPLNLWFCWEKWERDGRAAGRLSSFWRCLRRRGKENATVHSKGQIADGFGSLAKLGKENTKKIMGKPVTKPLFCQRNRKTRIIFIWLNENFCFRFETLFYYLMLANF